MRISDWSSDVCSSDLTEARYASYEDLATVIRHRFVDPAATLAELYARIIFNILCGNTDDHARNHAAFWDGGTLELTPAYDICPQGRSEEHTSELQSLMRISYAVFCLNKKTNTLVQKT